jgi:hypothetical protein
MPNKEVVGGAGNESPLSAEQITSSEALRGQVVEFSTIYLPDLYVKVRLPNDDAVWAVDFKNSLGYDPRDTRNSSPKVSLELLEGEGWSTKYRVVSHIPTPSHHSQKQDFNPNSL